MKDKRIYTSFRGLFLIYLPIYLLISIIFYLIVGIKFPPTLNHYLTVGGWTIITAIYLIFGYKNSYYELTKHEIVHHKGSNILYYKFDDIIYIDKVYSGKKLSIRFFTRIGDERYLAHDPKKKVYNTMLERCTNLIDKEELLRRFPKIKY